MAEVFVLGGGTPTPTEFRPGGPKPLIIEPRNPRNHVPKFQAKFGVAEEEPHSHAGPEVGVNKKSPLDGGFFIDVRPKCYWISI